MKQRHSLPSTNRIDVHCHLFNKKVLSWRLLIDFIQSRVELPMQTTDVNLFDTTSSSSKFKRDLNFLKIGMQSTSEDVYKTLAKTEKGYAVVPLMFDLDYCMKGSQGNNMEREVLADCKQILLDEQEKLQPIKQTASSFTNSNSNNERHEVVDQINELIQTINSLSIFANKANKFESAQQEDTFLNQENQLVDLQKKYPDMIFPFYAVDPRREENYTFVNGVYDLSNILNRLAINGGHFYGIKLYTPNGYSPAAPMLMALYEYCEKHAIPIIAHCSGGGFASFAKIVDIHGLIYRNGKIEEHNGSITFEHYKVADKERVHEKAQMLNHPLIWEKVLEKYPNLILDLAHFGNSKGSEEWSQHIIRLMKRYPNLYTDFSCVTECATLNNMYTTYYSKAEPSVKSRFLYGSDFYLNMLFINTMEQYINKFEKIFSAAEMKEIAEINPRRFLGFI